MQESPYWSYGCASLRAEAVTDADVGSAPDSTRPADASGGSVYAVEMNDPARRNALGEEMFESLHAALRQAAVLCAEHDARGRPKVRAMVLRGAGPAFCGGFDLAACNARPALLRTLVERLSAAVQALRTLPVPVVAQVQGAALAGGCALVAGCDFAVVAPDSQLGYPVHRIGVSPAVNLPVLLANAGAGSTRAITMGGAIYRGADAVRAGLATHLAPSEAELPATVTQLCQRLCNKGPQALRTTKAWLNDLDGTAGGAHFAHAAEASAAAAEGDEFSRLLKEFWASRK